MPLEILHVDHFGPLTETNDKFKHISYSRCIYSVHMVDTNKNYCNQGSNRGITATFRCIW